MIYNPPIGRDYTTYIPLKYCLFGDYISPTILREPETAADLKGDVLQLAKPSEIDFQIYVPLYILL